MKLNVTAILTLEQVAGVPKALNPKVLVVVSVSPDALRTPALTRCRTAREQKTPGRAAAGGIALGERP